MKLVGVTLRPALARVVRALEARDTHSSTTLADALRSPVGIDDVAPWIRFDPSNYVRNLVCRREGWELRLHCWRPGQMTSLHGHGDSACAFRVLRGSATEVRLGSRDRLWAPDDVVEESGRGIVHQLGNSSGDALLTLHAYSPPLPVETPSPRAGRSVVIIGGGWSGAALAFHLLRRGGPDLRVTIVERGPWLGRGVAYGVDSDVFRLNVPASKMSIDPERPNDFVEWADAKLSPSAFLPRALFGQYTVAKLADAIRTSHSKLRIVRGEAIAVGDADVELAGGARLPADVVVLATGVEPRLAPSSLPSDGRIIDAWDECALAALPNDGNLLVLGAGLTALDVLASLDAHGFQGKVTILSRRGLLPRAHLAPLRAASPLSLERVEGAPRELRPLLAWVRAVVREHEARGEPWQVAVDALRAHTTKLYQRLSPSDRARFARSVRPYWDVLRHRAPVEALALVDQWRSQGRLRVCAGRIVLCDPLPTRLDTDILYASGKTERCAFDRIIRCLGPALDRSESEAPLVHQLLASGLAAPDPAGLGISTDEFCRVLDAALVPSERIFALGSLRRASSWETTSVPDISVSASELAKRIVS